MTAVLNLEPGRWYGWLEEPVEARHFGASPVKLTSVQPLKSGQGLLKLGFIQPLHQGGGTERTVVLDIVQRAETHITGIFDKDPWRAR